MQVKKIAYLSYCIIYNVSNNNNDNNYNENNENNGFIHACIGYSSTTRGSDSKI